MNRQPGLFDEVPPDPDAAARAFATDPRHNVVLEASAGTGKTSVLVERYLNLLGAGVDPANILAITFTRKAAAEMRERILAALRQAAQQSESGRRRWRSLRDRLSDIAISTIDAFCYALLREFPLEAGLDPGFSVADETETARLTEEAIDRALRHCRGIAREDEAVALVLTRLAPRRLRSGLAHLVDRRLVAPAGLRRYLRGAPADLDVEAVRSRAAARLAQAVRSVPGGLPQFLADGPIAHPRFTLVAADLRALDAGQVASAETLWAVAESLRFYFLTQEGRPRSRAPSQVGRADAPSDGAWRRHGAALKAVAPAVRDALAAWARDLNVLLARGVARIFAVTLAEHRRTLAEHEVVDFPELLERAVELLRQMDEFSQSRYRLESRYHHVLVDEFQDTSRLQWELVALLVQSWGEGFGLVHEAPLLPSLFIVGDRKQSIYRFRDADVTLLDAAAQAVARLRPEGGGRRYISRSFRALPDLLAFVNDVCAEVAATSPARPDAFTYVETDRFPVEADPASGGLRDQPIRLVADSDPDAVAGRVAAEIARLIGHATVRDRQSGVARLAEPGDIAILFRSRESHREVERALEARGIPAYVYKGLGFFDADEIKDLLALIRFLAAPASDLRAAALLRSRLVRLSDEGLRRLAPSIARALTDPEPPAVAATLDDEDRRVLELTRRSLAHWLTLVDRHPPAEVLDHILAASAYENELIGPRRTQARENVKKLRALVRRIGNRGYATMSRLAAHVDRLATGDEANAVLEAVEAVNLMTVHASKGLEFPIVFLVNLGRGVARRRPAVRVQLAGHEEEGEASVSIDSFQSDADELEPALEREETKRLLYVALTRARDALYLSTIVKDERARPGSGSLGQVLPGEFPALFAAAGQAADGTTLVWQGRSRLHTLVVAAPASTAVAVAPRPETLAAPAVLPLPEVLWPAVPRRSVTSTVEETADRAHRGVASPGDGGDASDAEAGRGDRRLVGRLVHRLLRLSQPGSPPDDVRLRDAARRLITDEERWSLDEADAVVDEAVRLFRRLSARSELVPLLTDGVAEYEVPCSVLAEGRVLRGTIDCLVRRPDGVLVVVEIKTGRPRAADERQLALYVSAVRGLSPGTRATGLLIYP